MLPIQKIEHPDNLVFGRAFCGHSAHRRSIVLWPNPKRPQCDDVPKTGQDSARAHLSLNRPGNFWQQKVGQVETEHNGREWVGRNPTQGASGAAAEEPTTGKERVKMILLNGVEAVKASLLKTYEETKWAMAQALNDTAKDVQAFELAKELPGAFTLRARGNPWQTAGTKFGVNVRPFATKGNLSATVGSQADWLAKQETGGTKTVSGHRVAVGIAKNVRSQPEAVILSRFKPSALLKSGRGFKIKFKDGSEGIFARIANARKSGSSRNIVLLYFLTASTHIKKRISFEQHGHEVVDKTYQSNFDRRLAVSLATMTARQF